MKQEEKALLLKDLCARLPYGVMIQIPELFYPQRKVTEKLVSINDLWHFNDNGTYIENVRPYLRSMEDMTEEERKEFSKLLDKRYCEEDWEGHVSISYCIEIDIVYTDDEDGIKHPCTFSMDAIDWLNMHYFDYRGLIKKGLAIKVTKDNNPYKE